MNTETETLSVVVEREIPHPPEKLWRALTQPHLISEWLMKNDFSRWWAIASISAWTRNRPCPSCWIARCWPSSRTRRCPTGGIFLNDNPAFALKSVVTFTLTPTDKGTHLRMEQAGFRPDQKQAYGGAKFGWQKYLANLEEVSARAD